MSEYSNKNSVRVSKSIAKAKCAELFGKIPEIESKLEKASRMYHRAYEFLYFAACMQKQGKIIGGKLGWNDFRWNDEENKFELIEPIDEFKNKEDCTESILAELFINNEIENEQILRYVLNEQELSAQKDTEEILLNCNMIDKAINKMQQGTENLSAKKLKHISAKIKGVSRIPVDFIDVEAKLRHYPWARKLRKKISNKYLPASKAEYRRELKEDVDKEKIEEIKNLAKEIFSNCPNLKKLHRVDKQKDKKVKKKLKIKYRIV